MGLIKHIFFLCSKIKPQLVLLKRLKRDFVNVENIEIFLELRFMLFSHCTLKSNEKIRISVQFSWNKKVFPFNFHYVIQLNE